MGAYIVRRLLFAPVVLLAVSFITFTLGHFGPGDPVQVLLGMKNDPVLVERIRQERGLDQPFVVQYTNYVSGVLRGDFGESYQYVGQPVKDLIFGRIWVSVQLGAISLAIGVVIGMIFGLIAAMNQGKWFDPAIVVTALLISSLPIFIIQPFFAFILSRQLHLLPSSGWECAFYIGPACIGVLHAKIIMPALVLSLGPIGGITRLMRASTLEVVNQDFVRTARAKGLSEGAVRLHHITRNSVLPIFTVIGLSLATLVEGGFIAETLFGIPGVGRLAVDSFFARDYPVIMAMTLIVATSYILANLIIDIGYTFLDPRIRLQ